MMSQFGNFRELSQKPLRRNHFPISARQSFYSMSCHVMPTTCTVGSTVMENEDVRFTPKADMCDATWGLQALLE
jgi:hypothetical protein